MIIPELNIVTGAFSFTGRYIAKQLLKNSFKVRTITNHPRKHSELYDKIEVVPYHFEDYNLLVKSLEGGVTFFNTYWIRFPWGEMTWKKTIDNSALLFQACKDAGIRKIVHISVTNPSLNSPYDYFRSKAEVEKLLEKCGVPYTIIRPALIFEIQDVLLNNIAYLLRRLPIFGIFGKGDFLIQPIAQEDLAKIVVDHRYNGQGGSNEIINAIGPETFTFKEIVSLLNAATNSKTWLIDFPDPFRILLYFFSKLIGWVKRDILLTWQEMEALRNNLLFVIDNPTGTTSFEAWVMEYGDQLGKSYTHEINRHYK